MTKDDEGSAEVMRLLAHELRNPLSAVQLNAQLIERAAAAAGNDKELRWAGLITGAARRMDGMIRQLVETERLRLGRLELSREPVAFCQLVRDVLVQSEAELDRQRFHLALPERPVVVSADRERLGRAIHGLLCLTLHEADGVVAVQVEARDGEVTSAIHARRSPAVAMAAPSARQPAAAIAFHFAQTLFQCHGGSARASNEDPEAIGFELVLPTGTATSART